jgi:hypothetical protein
MKVSVLSDDDEDNMPGLQMVDHRHDLDEVLKQIDEQLVEFGLEIENFDTGGDYYAWRIVRR